MDNNEAVAGALIVLIFIGILFIFPCVTQWAWNIFMPAVFGLPNIGWWQAVALQWLCFLVTPTSFKRK